VYGYARPTTPYLSRLVREGTAVRMQRAVSVCSQSSCGLLGIASGRYVHQFPDVPLTLAEALRMNGYKAHLVLGGDHTNFYGLRKTYGDVDTYFDASMGTGYINDDAQVLAALLGLQTTAKTGNFIQLHLMSAHLLGRREAPDRFGPAQGYHRALGGVPPSREDFAKYINFYDAGVAQADDVVRRALDILRQKGLLDDALVVVTADHGEFLGEHGLFGHAKDVRAEVLDVPLILMRFGHAAPLRMDEGRLASQVDIAPTVLAQLGLPVPAPWTGVPLQSADPRAEREVFFQQGAEFGLVARTRDGRTWQYWVHSLSGQEFAYDLDNDPTEQINRVDMIDAGQRRHWRSLLLPLEASVKSTLPPP